MTKTTLYGGLAILTLAALVPFALIARSRARTSPMPPVHLILDMDKQPKFKGQRENPMFADGRAMRPPVLGVVAREDIVLPAEVLNDPEYPRVVNGSAGPTVPQSQAEYDAIMLGQKKGKDNLAEFVTEIPLPVTKDVLRRGQERFNIYCAPCHGASGYGDGMIARRAAEMQAAGSDAAAGWTPPPNFHTDDLRSRQVGNIYNTITNGIRTMPRYDKQISVSDRWAVVAYLKALQRSQNARPEDVPANVQPDLGK